MDIGIAELGSSKIYHVYNRSNGNEILFKDDADRELFIRNIARFLLPIMDVYAYCLMRNHFHLLVKLKSEIEIKNYIYHYYAKRYRCADDSHFLLLKKSFDFPDVQTFISKQFSNMFDSYSKVFNLKHARHGNLFERPFQRKLVVDNDYLKYLFFYIHINPIRDSSTLGFRDAFWSSYNDIIENNQQIVDLEFVYTFFGSQKEFEQYHSEMLSNIRMKFDWVEVKSNMSSAR